jgi:hypothetical protein
MQQFVGLELAYSMYALMHVVGLIGHSTLQDCMAYPPQISEGAWNTN